MHGRLTVPFALFLLAGCTQQSPEAQIEKAFDACVQAIEDGEAGDAVEALSPQFSGPEGMSREEARLYLMGLLRREKVGINVLASRIEVKANQAVQSVEVLLTGRSGGGLLPQEAGRRVFLLRWEHRDSHWRLRSLQEAGRP